MISLTKKRIGGQPLMLWRQPGHALDLGGGGKWVGMNAAPGRQQRRFLNLAKRCIMDLQRCASSNSRPCPRGQGPARARARERSDPIAFTVHRLLSSARRSCETGGYAGRHAVAVRGPRRSGSYRPVRQQATPGEKMVVRKPVDFTRVCKAWLAESR